MSMTTWIGCDDQEQALIEFEGGGDEGGAEGNDVSFFAFSAMHFTFNPYASNANALAPSAKG